MCLLFVSECLRVVVADGVMLVSFVVMRVNFVHAFQALVLIRNYLWPSGNSSSNPGNIGTTCKVRNTQEIVGRNL